MLQNHRHFEAGPDPFGRNWQVEFRWLQTAISIRHADAVDVSFVIACGGDRQEKVVALSHPGLVRLAKRLDRRLTDPWCMKLAALHLKEMIETDTDMDKTLVTVADEDLERHAKELEAVPA